jgi:signal peptidase I
MRVKQSFWFLCLLLFAAFIASIITFQINPYNTASDTFRGRVLGFELFRIPSHSMQPTLLPGDYIYVSTNAYKDQEPEINDVITFLYPKDRNVNYIKRLIGRPGDRVRIEKFIVYVNDIAIEQSYLNEHLVKKSFSRFMQEKTVPENKLFVLGDNRDNSNDGRFFGMIDRADIIGKATRVLFGKNHRMGTAIE